MSRAFLPLVALALVLAGGCERTKHGGTWKKVQARGLITWGADRQGGEPYLYDDADGNLVGFEVDIMRALARELGVEQKFVHNDWSNLVPGLERGDFDIVMNGLEATDERQQRILLSRPYYIYAETLAVKKGSRYRSLDDLEGKRVATLNQTYAYDLLREAPVETVPYEGNEEPYRDLVLGRVDAVLLDNIIADRYGCSQPEIECLPDDVARGVYVIGIRREDPELRDAIDVALGKLIDSGELERILRNAGLWDHRQREPAPEIARTRPRARQFDAVQFRLFVEASLYTLGISAAAFALAVPLGLLLAIARVYGGPVAGGAARVYIELFRGTPVLLQLYVLYFGLAPYYNLGPIQAAVLGLGLNYGAYEAEVYRGALLAIPRGQVEAAKALGFGPVMTLRHVLVPQALRLALPPMTNDFVSLLKDSSLVGVITVIELTKRMTITAVDMQDWLIPGIACAAFYLALSFPLSELARRLERRLARDQRPHTL